MNVGSSRARDEDVKEKIKEKKKPEKVEEVEEKKPEPVAEKAKPTDVLGDKAVKDAAPKEEKVEAPQKESKDSTES